jgi:hypothetical protein
MSKLIEEAKRIEDFVSDNETVITDDVKKILKQVAVSKEGVVVEIPWDAEVNGEYMESVTVVITKVTKERVYFLNPVKVTNKACKVTEKNKKGPPRIIHEDRMESMLLTDFFQMSKKTPVLGIVNV